MSTTAAALLGARYRRGSPLPALTPHQAVVRDQILSNDRPQDWEEARCLCGSSDDLVLSEVERHGLPYRKCLCRACGLLRVSPRWTAERYQRFYAQEYRALYSGRSPQHIDDHVRWVAGQPGSRAVAAYVRSALTRYLQTTNGDSAQTPRTVLEIGAGGGWNLAHLPGHWNRIGYDVDDAYLSAGRKLFGVDMRRGFFEEALPGIHQADLVLLSHVVEHLPDPVTALSRIASELRDGAMIAIEVPGIFRIHHTARDPMVYMQNAHLYTFCAATLSRVCEMAGLHVLAVDEWCRAVARPGGDKRPKITPADPQLHRRIASYLQWCERGYGLQTRIRCIPAGGPVLERLVRTAWATTMHAALRTHLL